MVGPVSPLLPALAGGGVGLGLVLVIAGARGRQVLPTVRRRPRPEAGDGRAERVYLTAAGIGVLAWVATGWLGVGVALGCAVAVVPRLFTGQRDRQAWIAKTEAIAAWTEMLRDTMAAASGVEAAISATVPIGPPALRPALALLDARRRSEMPLADALAAFADDVDHPSADLVITALVAASEGEGADFNSVLGRLAAITRSDVRMRHEVEAGRAQLHTASRIILGVLAVAVGGFLVLSADYFGPYATTGGQLVLVVVAALFTAGTVLLDRMSRIEAPERFVVRRRGTTS